ncbi:MAG: bifunctional phosphoribosylaminoimidazolecarboxamide formyltransferase/IMP cyclohydrolase [Thermoplasmata archaeon]
MASEAGPSVRIERALLSVDDKTGLTDLGRGLAELGVELWATGGTRTTLEKAGVPARSAEELTGIGAWFGGRVKTLHPALLGGILAPRTESGRAELAERGLLPFDLVVVNFYPFERHLEEAPHATDREEYVDIGGVTLVRAAAKNHAGVAVVTSPTEYGTLLEELRGAAGSVSAATRVRLARRAFERVAAYDGAIAGALFPPEAGADPFPETIVLRREPLKLRYGENPHQRAAVFGALPGSSSGFVARPFEVLKGDSLSYTNLLDVDTALSIVAEYPLPAAAVVKHATPCGVAEGRTIREALERAIATDPVARFGCAIAVNTPLGPGDADALHGVFVDLLAAPALSTEAREALGRRPKLKLIRTDPPPLDRPRWEAKTSFGRVLVQETDRRQLVLGEFRPVTSHRATPEQLCHLDFAWRVVRHAKSNAIVLASGPQTVGIGSGQPTRVKAVQIACEVAGDRARGAVLASDAFFPFADGVELAARAGVVAILQPGGSLRDPEVIAVAEKAGIAMYFTGWRVFRH